MNVFHGRVPEATDAIRRVTGMDTSIVDAIHRVSDTTISTMEYIDHILPIVNVFQGRVHRVGGETHDVKSAIHEALDLVLPRFEQTNETMEAVYGLKSEIRLIHGCVTMSECRVHARSAWMPYGSAR